MIRADVIIVGSGLTGATIARTLHDAGREVLVLERREQVGGNVVDAVHEPSNIRFGKYGPHYFRCSCERIWEFATRFSAFHPYEARVLASIDGELVPWPPQREWIERLCGKDWKPEFTGRPANFEEACLSMMPRGVYEKCVLGYNLKQWNRHPRELSASLCKRFDIRDGETRLTPNARWQGLPRDGYTAWMESMLKGIPVVAGFDYLKRREEVTAKRKLIFTGPIDEFFGCSLGRLEYRAQKRTHIYTKYASKSGRLVGGCLLPVAQVNTPQMEDGPSIRTIEWKHLMPAGSEIRGSLLTKETPFTPEDSNDFEYPQQDEANDRLRAAYRDLAKTLPDVVFAGRLGRGQYLDMDQSIGAALKLADLLCGR